MKEEKIFQHNSAEQAAPEQPQTRVARGPYDVTDRMDAHLRMIAKEYFLVNEKQQEQGRKRARRKFIPAIFYEFAKCPQVGELLVSVNTVCIILNSPSSLSHTSYPFHVTECCVLASIVELHGLVRS